MNTGSTNGDRLAASLIEMGVDEGFAQRARSISKGNEGTWRSYLKLEAIRQGHLRTELFPPDSGDATTAVLHVFPIGYTEEPGIRQRLLANETEAATTKYAQPRIRKTTVKITPIDRVAARVTNFELQGA